MDNEIFSIEQLKTMSILANDSLSSQDLQKAQKILLDIHQKTALGVNNGKGPFYAEIYDKNGELLVASSNSVIDDMCALHHAEVNTLTLAHNKLKDYNLAPYDLTIYINAEPCMMCLGAIMWSGVKRVFYSVPSKDVEAITGFDEGFKPNWLQEFASRGIKVYGNIASTEGKKVLSDYVALGRKVYKPTR